MNNRLYRVERKTAEFWFGLIEISLVVMLVERLIAGALGFSVFIFVTALIFAAYRLIKGPLMGPALLEVTDGELIWRQPIYIPTKIQRIRLSAIKTIQIVGPARDRRFRIETIDGSQLEIRPFFGWRTRKAILFLRNFLPENVKLIEEKPSSFMSQIRGDY